MYSRFFTTDFTQGEVKLPPTCFSGSRLARNKIPAATPPFSGTRNSKVLLRILPDVTGSGKSKMAVVKQEMFIYPLLDNIATKFQRLPQFSRSSNTNILIPISTDAWKWHKFKMAAAKPEVFTCHFKNTILIRIFPLLDEIATKFQRLPYVVRIQKPNGDRADTARCNRKLEIQDGGQ